MDRLRVLGWNIRAGGGKRVEGIFAQILTWAPQVIVLSEFRSTAPSSWLADHLASAGYCHQRRVTDVTHPAQNQVFIASTYPLRILRSRVAPTEPARWLMAKVYGPIEFSLGAMHIPNQHTGRKPQYHQAVVNLARAWKLRAGMFIGDTNSGQIGLDEENPVFNQATDQWFRDLAGEHWADVFRLLHGDKREFTWYSPNAGNGFRLDQGFISEALHNQLHTVAHVWGQSGVSFTRRDELSDHAALIVDFKV